MSWSLGGKVRASHRIVSESVKGLDFELDFGQLVRTKRWVEK